MVSTLGTSLHSQLANGSSSLHIGQFVHKCSDPVINTSICVWLLMIPVLHWLTSLLCFRMSSHSTFDIIFQQFIHSDCRFRTLAWIADSASFSECIQDISLVNYLSTLHCSNQSKSVCSFITSYPQHGWHKTWNRFLSTVISSVTPTSAFKPSPTQSSWAYSMSHWEHMHRWSSVSPLLRLLPWTYIFA